jgi:hypothetical protein
MKNVWLSLIAVVGAGFSTGVLAQDTVVWADMDCAQSKIVAPAGLKCRATQEINGSSNGRFNGGGIFKSWTAYGSVDGVKFYYHVSEGVGARSYKQIFLSLIEEAKSLSPDTKRGKDFSPPSSMNGDDYLRFTSARGEPCVAIRKPGPVQGAGYKWVLVATKCVAPGKSISDQDLGQFMAAADFHA